MIYENVFQAHYVRPYNRPTDRFGQDFPDIWQTEDEIQKAQAQDEYILALRELEFDPNYQDPESQSIIRAEISKGLAEIETAIRTNIPTQTTRQSPVTLIQGFINDLASRTGKTPSKTPTVKKQDNTPLILAGAGAVALVAIALMR